MLMRIRYGCTCGCKYNSLHYVLTDDIRQRLTELKQLCPNCNKRMDSSIQSFPDSPLVAVGTAVRFIDTNFVQIDEGELSLNLNNLLSIGYSGIVSIYLRDGTIKFVIDPIANTIKKVK